MTYTELTLTFNGSDPAASEILTAELAELGFESFIENEAELKAYILSNLLQNNLLDKVIEAYDFFNFSYTFKTIEQQNWNAEWEKNYDPIIIANKCIVRAPFHKNTPKLPYEIVIMPKMSFGTGHHATTSLMIEHILTADFKNKTVLDMGSGTGVLAILAHMLGATDITAIDYDQWAFENALENTKNNNAENIECLHGSVDAIPDKKFDVILANINKNILLDQMNTYSDKLKSGGDLYLSGFYDYDLNDIKSCAMENQLSIRTIKSQNNWNAVKFKKQ